MERKWHPLILKAFDEEVTEIAAEIVALDSDSQRSTKCIYALIMGHSQSLQSRIEAALDERGTQTDRNMGGPRRFIPDR